MLFSLLFKYLNKSSVSVSFISTPPQTKTSKNELVNIVEQQKKKKEEATKTVFSKTF